jgi:hypothetical protein
MMHRATCAQENTMKTMFLTLAAVLGFALGTASLIPAAHASSVYDQGGDHRTPQYNNG